MILDNENENLKVHEWISKYTKTGKLNVVTGYFTIGALAYLSHCCRENIDEFKFVLGDIVNFDAGKDRALELLNENINIEASLKLSKESKLLFMDYRFKDFKESKLYITIPEYSDLGSRMTFKPIINLEGRVTR